MGKTSQNITLSLPKETLRQVKILAAKRDTSVSALRKEKLEERLQKGDYEQAHSAFLRAVEEGFDLGTQGRLTWSCDGAHER